MHDPDMAREFDVEMDLTDIPGAGAPGPRPEERIPLQKERPTLGTSEAAALATAALLVDMPDRRLWKELDAAQATALEALEAGSLAIARRATARQEALLREVRRRHEGGRYERYKRA